MALLDMSLQAADAKSAEELVQTFRSASGGMTPDMRAFLEGADVFRDGDRVRLVSKGLARAGSAR